MLPDRNVGQFFLWSYMVQAAVIPGICFYLHVGHRPSRSDGKTNV